MISKHIHCKALNDNYKRLANYISAAHSKNEKCKLSWCAGCYSDNDYETAIDEVIFTQELNQRTTKEKTYHLMISFRKEDEGKVSDEDFKNIELEFAKALGFTEHQRHCGVHVNTTNMHIHVAYNMIHPQNHIRYEPYKDYNKRDQVCRELEKKYGLSIDNGIDKNNQTIRLNDSSARSEAQTGEESFERYCHNQHDELMELVYQATSWEDIHTSFALYGLEIKPSGNGLTIKNSNGKQSIKASKLDRKLSMSNLTKLYGEYASPKNIKNISPKNWYNRKPVIQHIEFKELWQEFIKQNGAEEIQTIKETYYQKKTRLITLGVNRKTKNDLLKILRNKERTELNAARLRLSKESKENWLTFLQDKAALGDERALVLLQTKKPKIHLYRQKLWQIFEKEQLNNGNEVNQEGFIQYLQREVDLGNEKAISLLQFEKSQFIQEQEQSPRDFLWSAFEKDQNKAFSMAKKELKNKVLTPEQLLEETYNLKKDYQVNQANFIRYLQCEAANGNLLAYGVLKAEERALHEQDKSLSQYQQHLMENSKRLAEKQKILLSDRLSQNKNKLLDIKIMENLLKDTVEYTISRTGAIIYHTAHGKVIDEGKKITFTDNAKDLAIDYFTAKYGVQELTQEQKNEYQENILNSNQVQALRKKQELAR